MGTQGKIGCGVGGAIASFIGCISLIGAGYVSNFDVKVALAAAVLGFVGTLIVYSRIAKRFGR